MIKTIFNNTSIFVYVIIIVFNIIFCHYYTVKVNMIKIFGIKISLPVKRYITSLNYKILIIFYRRFDYFLNNRLFPE